MFGIRSKTDFKSARLKRDHIAQLSLMMHELGSKFDTNLSCYWMIRQHSARISKTRSLKLVKYRAMCRLFEELNGWPVLYDIENYPILSSIRKKHLYEVDGLRLIFVDSVTLDTLIKHMTREGIWASCAVDLFRGLMSIEKEGHQ